MASRAADRKQERISRALAVAAVLLGASAFGKVAGFYVQHGRLQGTLPPAPSARDPDGLKRCLGESQKAAAALKQNNLFIKTPPKEQPVKQVEGILGSEALIGGKWYKAGDTIADAKIVAVNATDVKIEWDGKQISLSPIASVSAGPAGLPGARDPRKDAGSPPGRPADVRIPTPPPAAGQDDPLAWVGVKLSPKLQAAFLERWSKATPEEREKNKEQWNKMSDEEKQKAVEAMESRM